MPKERIYKFKLKCGVGGQCRRNTHCFVSVNLRN